MKKNNRVIKAVLILTAAIVVFSSCDLSHTDNGEFSVAVTTVEQTTDEAVVDAASHLNMLTNIKVPGITSEIKIPGLSYFYPFLIAERGSSQIDWLNITKEDVTEIYDLFNNFQGFQSSNTSPDNVDEVYAYCKKNLPAAYADGTTFSDTPILITLSAWNEKIRTIWGAGHDFNGSEFYTAENADFSGSLSCVPVYLSDYNTVAIFLKSLNISGTETLNYIVSASKTSDGTVILKSVETQISSIDAAQKGIYSINSKTFEERQLIIADIINQQVKDGTLNSATCKIVRSVFRPNGSNTYYLLNIGSSLGIMQLQELMDTSESSSAHTEEKSVSR